MISVPWPRPSRGIALPIAIILVAALGAAALSILALARNELLMERGDLRYLRERSEAEAALGSFWEGIDAGGAAPVVPGLRSEVLPGGFLLAGVASTEAGPAHLAVAWRLDPEALALRFPGGVEVGADLPGGGVDWLDEACPPPHTTAPLVRVRMNPSPDSPAPIPPLSEPRLGLLDIGHLEALATTIDEGAEALGGDSPLLFRAPSGTAFSELQTFGVLVSSGDLILEGDAVFRGLMLLQGDLVLREGAVVEGVVLAGGSVRIEGEARILGCPGLAGSALAQPPLQGSHPVPGGTRLGRF